MNKPCQGRDELLLQMAHGQLGLFKRLQAQWHVRRCAACRERLIRYSSLSNALAFAMVSPSGPRWLPPMGVGKVLMSRGAALGLVIVALMLCFWSLRRSAEATQPPVTPKAAPGSTKSCLKAVESVKTLPPVKSCHPARK
jgi:hypothetical protein